MAVIPFFSEQVGGTGFEMGMFFTSYAITQMISVYLMGSWSDKYGRKLFLMLSLFGSFTGPLLQSFSTSMLMMNIFRAYTGLLAGSMTLGQAVIADLYPPEKRGSLFSFLLGIASSAFIIGPAIGGALGAIKIQMPFWISGGCAGIMFAIALCYLKESNVIVIKKNDLKSRRQKLLKKTALSDEETKEVDIITEELNKMNSKKTKKEEENIQLHWNKFMILWLIIRFLNECVSVIISSYYGLYMISAINATSLHYSIYLCCTGTAAVIVQIIIFPWLKDKLHISVVYIALIGAIIMFGGTMFMTFVLSPWLAIVAGFITFFGYAFISPIAVLVLSVQAPPECQGKALSVATVVSQAVYIIIPLLYGSFYDFSPFWTISSTIAFAGVLIILVLFLWCIPGSLTCADSKETNNSHEENLSSSSDALKEQKDIITAETKSPSVEVDINNTGTKLMESNTINIVPPSEQVDIHVPETEQSIFIHDDEQKNTGVNKQIIVSPI
ncbi:hypothetical protein WA158_002498 [Blastocystis sp. Blastoise]